VDVSPEVEIIGGLLSSPSFGMESFKVPELPQPRGRGRQLSKERQRQKGPHPSPPFDPKRRKSTTSAEDPAPSPTSSWFAHSQPVIQIDTSPPRSPTVEGSPEPEGSPTKQAKMEQSGRSWQPRQPSSAASSASGPAARQQKGPPAKPLAATKRPFPPPKNIVASDLIPTQAIQRPPVQSQPGNRLLDFVERHRFQLCPARDQAKGKIVSAVFREM
jgi:hypothetical protein